MKQTIKLNESQLVKIITETVKKVLREDDLHSQTEREDEISTQWDREEYEEDNDIPYTIFNKNNLSLLLQYTDDSGSVYNKILTDGHIDMNKMIAEFEKGSLYNDILHRASANLETAKINFKTAKAIDDKLREIRRSQRKK